MTTMTPATPSAAKNTRRKFNGHLIPGVTLATVIGAAFWLGGELSEIKNRLKGNWTVMDMVVHDLILESRNPTIKVPDSAGIVEARRKVNKS